MRYCQRCLYPENHPLGITFDAQGICSGCRIHEEKDTLDWDSRLDKLRKLVAGFRGRMGVHDCIIPVSGGRDSYFIVHTAKFVLGLHPLLVTYNQQYNTSRGIRNLAYLRTLMGCDLLSFTVSPLAVKKITDETLRIMGSMYWHCLAGQTVFPVQIAVRFKIPLIIWGAHQGIDQVGMFSHLDEVEMTRKYRKDHDLMGYEAEDLLKESSILNEKDILPYRYPHNRELESVGVRGIYLNNFIRWDSKAQHEEMIRLYGYETAQQPGTFDPYQDVDSFHYSGIHNWIKLAKWGYGKATDHACREIRLKRMTREEGIDYVDRYENHETSDLNLFLQWLKMSEREFRELVDSHRDLRIWEKKREGKWGLKDSVTRHRHDLGVNEARLKKKENCRFQITKPRPHNAEEKSYILVGRGWVDREAAT